jgi:hypothetical protein
MRLKRTRAAAHGALQACIHAKLRRRQEGAPSRCLLQVNAALRAEMAGSVKMPGRTCDPGESGFPPWGTGPARRAAHPHDPARA